MRRSLLPPRPVRGNRPWMTPVSALASMLIVITACAGNDPRPSSQEATGVASPSATPMGSVAARATTSPDVSPTPSAPAEAIEFEPLAEGLVAPVGIAHTADGTGDLYVIEKGGTVRRVRPPDGNDAAWRVESDPFLDVSDRVTAGSEQGLLGVAFHPGYIENRRVFAHYTDLVGDTVLAEYAAADDGSAVDAGSERVLLQVDQPYENHNGGMLAFGPDGYLYLALGDGGSGGDPRGHGQNTDTLLGSILRLDVDAEPEGDAEYAIPSDNPFREGGGAPEIWAYGLRNPWRFSFDRESGDLYIGDVGQSAWEEIDRQPADSPGGENYGWNVMEGAHCFRVAECDASGLTLPVAEYGHDEGCTVIGGYVYRGSAFPGLAGTYLYADYCSGRVWGLDDAGEARVLADTDLTLSAFGEDEAGEVYAVDLRRGVLYRVVPAQ